MLRTTKLLDRAGGQAPFDFLFLRRCRRESIPTRLAEKYPVATSRIEHLVKGCSSDGVLCHVLASQVQGGVR